MECLACGGAVATVGVLCRACALRIAPPDRLIPQHIESRPRPSNPEAMVVDGFGQCHAVAGGTIIGRHPYHGGLFVLAQTVTEEHAELRCTDSGWQVRDLGSRNGTFVDDLPVDRRAPLPYRTRLRLGDISLWFVELCAEHASHAPRSVDTADCSAGLVRYRVHHERVELCVVGPAAPPEGGTLLSRRSPDVSWAEANNTEMPVIEFHLLRTLCARALEDANSPAAARGTVSTRQLARDLPFQADHPDEGDVRQAVRRLRATLDELGAVNLIEAIPSRGYYVTRPVTVGG